VFGFSGDAAQLGSFCKTYFCATNDCNCFLYSFEASGCRQRNQLINYFYWWTSSTALYLDILQQVEVVPYDIEQAAARKSGERKKEHRAAGPWRHGSIAAELTQARPDGEDAHQCW
jgi:hypothetical protein